MKKFNSTYWIELRTYMTEGSWRWFWQIKCRNGRVKGISNILYHKKSLCINDAKSFGNSVGIEVRE